MTVRDLTTLQGYFDAGDMPTAANFQDLIETIFRPVVRVVTATPDSPSVTTDEVVLVDTSTIAAAVTINLPVGVANARLTIKDMGLAGTHSITINPNGAETIEGAASYVISANYGQVTLLFNGTVWYVV